MKSRPLLYYRTKEQVEAYRRIPVLQRLRGLEAQMEFFYHAMPKKARKIMEKLNRGDL